MAYKDGDKGETTMARKQMTTNQMVAIFERVLGIKPAAKKPRRAKKPAKK